MTEELVEYINEQLEIEEINYTTSLSIKDFDCAKIAQGKMLAYKDILNYMGVK